MSCVTTQEIRNFLENYCLDAELTYAKTGDTTLDSTTIDDIDTTNLKPEMRISGSGIPSGATIVTVGTDSIVISSAATATGNGVSLTITYYSLVTNYWIGQRRDNFVVPFIERKTKRNLSGTSQITEYYSGNGTSILMLNRRNVVSIDAIQYVTGDTSLNSINIQNIDLLSNEGIIKANSNLYESWNNPLFAKGDKNIKVTYTYGSASCPDELKECVKYLVCAATLSFIEGMTGGGDIGVQGWNKSYGPRGKYSYVRQELTKWAYDIIRGYTTGVVGS